MDANAIRMEAHRKAVQWIELNEGRAILYRAISKPGLTKKEQSDCQQSILENRISFLLQDAHKRRKLKLEMFKLYERECALSGYSGAASFKIWTQRRMAQYADKNRQLREWTLAKNRERLELLHLNSDMANAHTVSKTFHDWVHAASPRGLAVNQKLLQLSRVAYLPNNVSSDLASSNNSNASTSHWWDRYSFNFLCGF